MPSIASLNFFIRQNRMDVLKTCVGNANLIADALEIEPKELVDFRYASLDISLYKSRKDIWEFFVCIFLK